MMEEIIPNYIFQVWLTIDKPLNETPWAKANSIKWKHYCHKYGYAYKVIDDSNVDDFLGEDLDFFYNLRTKFHQIDFIKYKIINKEGGIYIDLDMEPVVEKDLWRFLKEEYIIGGWMNDKGKWEISNSVLGARQGQFSDLIEYSKAEYQRLKDNPTYLCWKKRFMLQTTGVRMFKRWCKQKGLSRTDDLNSYMHDEERRSWLGDLGTVTPRK